MKKKGNISNILWILKIKTSNNYFTFKLKSL